MLKSLSVSRVAPISRHGRRPGPGGSWVRGGCGYVRDAQGGLKREQAGLKGGAEERAGQFGEPLGATGAERLPGGVGQPVGAPFDLVPAVPATLGGLARGIDPPAGKATGTQAAAQRRQSARADGTVWRSASSLPVISSGPRSGGGPNLGAGKTRSASAPSAAAAGG